MSQLATDEATFRLFTTPGASVSAQLAKIHGRSELQIFGNRAGLLSLANVLLWLVGNAWRRELLSLAELPFLRVEPPLCVYIRLQDTDSTGRDGLLRQIDRGQQFEWEVAVHDLRRVALTLHELVSKPSHEYDRLQVAEESAIGIHFRMTDAANWV